MSRTPPRKAAPPKRDAKPRKQMTKGPAKAKGHSTKSTVNPRSGVVTTVTSRNGKPTQVTRTGFTSTGRPRTESAKLPLDGKKKWSF
jgi:hypothetical protein